MPTTLQSRLKDRWSPCGRREKFQDYYTVRPVCADYSDYWGTVVDPDGRTRTRETDAERIQFISDTEYLWNYVNSTHPDSVLDVGAGLGWLLSVMTAAHKAAVEISPQAIARLEADGVTVYSDTEEVPDHSQDAVIAHHVLEHLVDPIRVVAGIHRILRRGGLLVVGTPDFDSPCAKRFGDKYRMLNDRTHCSLFSLDGCLRLLRDRGFTVMDVRFPFPDRYATAETMLRWNDTSRVSPPWPGNWFTVFATK